MKSALLLISQLNFADYVGSGSSTRGVVLCNFPHGNNELYQSMSANPGRSLEPISLNRSF